MLDAANFDSASLQNADFSNCKFGLGNLPLAWKEDNTEADTSQPNKFDNGSLPTNFREANLSGATLHGSGFTNIYPDYDGPAALLPDPQVGVSFEGADLTEANLRDTNFFFNDGFKQIVDFRRATLIRSRFDRANITGARLWETQRDEWSIKKIVCGAASWDKHGNDEETYQPGRFERAFATRHNILLEYPEGMHAIDLALLPLIIEEIAKTYGRCDVSMKSAVDAGSRSIVILTVLDREGREDKVFVEQTNELRLKLMDAQRALCFEREIRQRAEMLLRYQEEKVLPMLLEAAVRGKTVKIGQIRGNYVDAENASYVEIGRGSERQPVSLANLQELLSHFASNTEQLRRELPDQQWQEMSRATDTIRDQLCAPQPDKGVLAQALDSLRKIAESASGSLVATALRMVVGL
jgi:hypothetical protein